MPIVGTMYDFNDYSIRTYAPDAPGVYGLYVSDGVIYYGEGISIRARLLSHHSGAEGPCTKGASTFNFELTSNHVQREKELLEECRTLYGRLPRCNERVG